MVNKKIIFGALILVLVVISTLLLFTKNQTTIPPQDNQTLISSNEKITINLGNGASEIPFECYQFRDNNRNPAYIDNLTTHIIEGTVSGVESKWKNEENKEIFTYVDFMIENYIKGTPFPTNEIQIMVCGGTIGDVTQDCMGSASARRFVEGKRLKIYLEEREWNNNLIHNVVCSDLGVEEI